MDVRVIIPTYNERDNIAAFGREDSGSDNNVRSLS